MPLRADFKRLKQRAIRQAFNDLMRERAAEVMNALKNVDRNATAQRWATALDEAGIRLAELHDILQEIRGMDDE